MSIHLAEAELLPETAPGAPPQAQPLFAHLEPEDEDRLAVARGVLGAAIISIPIWVLIGFTIYMLV